MFLEKINYEIKYDKLKKYARIYFKYLTSPLEKQEKFKKREGNFLSFPETHVINYLKEKNPFKELIKDLDKSKYTEKSMF